MTQQETNNLSMLRVGTILRGIYRIDSYLSSGGFGNTYVATNIEFDERVAIKEFFIKGVTQRDDNQTTVSVSNIENKDSYLTQREKFKKEARRLRKINNEHLVKVHDLFDENGTTYYVMDYVDGENLSEWLKRTGRPMTESEVCLILPQILDALKVVHEDGFCHLDIKPSNIMLEKGGKIKLIDFGASKQLGANGTLTTNAPTAFAQTPGYAPREQMEQNLDKIGPWTDIYALGATLYNLLTNNKPPLPTDIDDDMSEDKHNALPFPESVGGMKYLVLQMMKTNRLQRPQSIDAIISAEKTRKEEPKQTPKAAKTSQSSSAYDDEATIIAEPKPKKERKTETPKPKSKETNPGYSQTPPKQDTYTSSHIEDNGGGELSKNTIILMVGALLFVVLFVLYHVSESTSAPDQESTPAPTETTVQIVERMQYTTAIGNCQYSGPVDDANIPNGIGEAIFSDGRYYKGGFEHGVLTGEDCIFRYPEGDDFLGKFRNNMFWYGKYTIAKDESYFVGSFENGKPYDGIWYDKNGKVIEEIH
jgi:serine/threonine protein kinase